MEPLGSRCLMDSLLAVSLQGAGNLILATPALKAIAASGASVHLLVGSRPLAEMMETAEWIESVSWLEGGSPGLLPAAMRLRAKRFDASATFFPDGRRAAAISLIAGAPVRAGFSIAVPPWLRGAYTESLDAHKGTHDVPQNARILDALGLARPAELKLSIPVTEGDRMFALAFMDRHGLEGTGPVAVLHPGGRARVSARRWELRRYGELASRLIAEMDAGVILVGDDTERPMLETAASAIGAGTAVLAGEATLRETAAVIERCSLFIGNDSGPLHIAAAVGTPVVGIYGPTDARRTAPYGVPHEVVAADVDCRPCYEFGVAFSCRRESLVCLEAIDVARVFDAGARLLEDSRGTL
jgi:lipopolysaccharide heptosyltransferase II